MPIVTEHPMPPPEAGPPPAGLFVTDLDGTLLRSDRRLAPDDRESLEHLGRRGIVRVIATGRSMFSFRTVAVGDLPVDFIVFSTGAGVVDHPAGRLLRSVCLEPAELRRPFELLSGLGLDFMVHRPVPHSHVFGFVANSPPCPDFERRLAIYRDSAFALEGPIEAFGPAAQLVAIAPPGRAPQALAAVRGGLGRLSVIRTTSPLDGRSTWIEIFAEGVSKSRTVAWLAARLGISERRTLAVGNDFNDLDLLEWAHRGCVVANAPAELRHRFEGVPSNDEGGVSRAVARWLAWLDSGA
jgi:hypothetical protein